MVSETFLLRVPSSKLSWRLAGLASSSCRVGVSFPQLPAQKNVFPGQLLFTGTEIMKEINGKKILVLWRDLTKVISILN
jgi:hypothetical protein